MLLLLPTAWCCMHRVLRLLCCHLLYSQLALQCQLSCVTTALCLLVPFLSPPVAPLYPPSLLCICAFLHRHVSSNFLQAHQLWQVLDSKCTWCTSVWLQMFHRRSVFFTVFSGSRPRWQGRKAPGCLAYTLKCTHTVTDPLCGKLLVCQ